MQWKRALTVWKIFNGLSIRLIQIWMILRPSWMTLLLDGPPSRAFGRQSSDRRPHKMNLFGELRRWKKRLKTGSFWKIIWSNSCPKLSSLSLRETVAGCISSSWSILQRTKRWTQRKMSKFGHKFLITALIRGSKLGKTLTSPSS